MLSYKPIFASFSELKWLADVSFFILRDNDQFAQKLVVGTLWTCVSSVIYFDVCVLYTASLA